MKKFILCFFATAFPFTIFLFLDLPGAAFVALGLQSTIIGWPIAIGWAFKHALKYCDESKLKYASAIAAAAAEAATKAQFEAQEKANAEARKNNS